MTSESRRFAAGEADLVDLWPAVAAQRAAFLHALNDVTEEQAIRRPEHDPEGWCVLQVAQHVLGWTDNVDEVIEALASGRTVAKHPRGFIDPLSPATLAEVRHALVERSIPLRLAAGAAPRATQPRGDRRARGLRRAQLPRLVRSLCGT